MLLLLLGYCLVTHSLFALCRLSRLLVDRYRLPTRPRRPSTPINRCSCSTREASQRLTRTRHRRRRPSRA